MPFGVEKTRASVIVSLIFIMAASGCTAPEATANPAPNEDTYEPAEMPAQDTALATLEEEVNGIITMGALASPDHFLRMMNDLNALAAGGADEEKITTLAVKLETLNPARYESNSAGSPADKTIAALPVCSGQQFTVPPVELNNVYEISPMGNLAPPGHTLPTDHMYIHVSGGMSTTATVPLKSPGDVYILSVTSDPDDIAPERSEYSITFALCRDVFGYFNHVKGISSSMSAWLGGVECEKYTQGQHDSCTKTIFQKVPAGNVIGEVGHLQGNFDFGAYDYRTRLDFANLSRYGEDSGGLWRPRALYITCPLELYENEAKAGIYGKLAGNNGCGKTLYDARGTLQGNWFYGDSRADTGPYSGHLSFAYDNKNPSQAVISIGGTIASAGKLAFAPQDSGATNVRFDRVSPDGKTYCYTNGSSKVLVMMESGEQISVEYKSGSCFASESLASPYTYRR